MSKPSDLPSWRIVAAEIIAATKADPDSLRSIYEDREFRPGRNASVWAQLSARLAQERKAYGMAAAKGCLKEVQHTMLRRCFAHDYSQLGCYMITMTVPERGSNPFGVVKGDVRQGREGLTLSHDEAQRRYADFAYGDGPLRLELTPLGQAVLGALEGIPANYPMVVVRKAQLMPDHLHLILEVTAPIVSSNGTPRHLGHVLAGYKKGCNRVYWDICSMGEPWNTKAKSAAPAVAAGGMTPVVAAGGMTSVVAAGGTASEVAAGNVAAEGGVVQFPCTKRLPSNARTGRPSIWAAGYTDTIILNAKHMQTEEAYLDDNIYRLRMKQLHRDLFRTVHHIRINGHDFAALGNIHLLRNGRKEQVQFHHWEADVPAGFWPCERGWNCRRFYSLGEPRNTTLGGTMQRNIFTLGSPIVGPTEAEAHTERLMKAGDEGAVFVSPFISETEKALRVAALTMGIPYIRLTREGFRDLYTPLRSEFEACCEGNLLLLAPWEDRRRTTTITRSECLTLNQVAAEIAADDLDLRLIGTGCASPIDTANDNNETILPRDDE